MNIVEIIGYQRKNLGTSYSKRLRSNGNVPCVLYGGINQVHFYSPIGLFKNIVYSSETKFINVNIEGCEYKCILQDIQFHPVSETILHIDFLKIFDNKKIKMNIPVNVIGKSKGIAKGGVLAKKIRSLQIIAYPKDMPLSIDLDVSNLDVGNSFKVKDVKTDNYKILNFHSLPILSIIMPRVLKIAKDSDEEDPKKEK